MVAGRGFALQARAAIRDHAGQIDVEPMQLRRQRQPVGTGVQAATQVDDGSGTVGNAIEDDFVDHRGANDHRPGHRLPVRQRAHDRGAAFSGQASGIGIMEQRVVPLGLGRAIHRRPERGVGDVADR